MNADRQPIVIALGGNALDPGTNGSDYPSLPEACRVMADWADDGLVVTHGNGPQIGTLALDRPDEQSLDQVGAETQGELGYVIEQELGNHLPRANALVSLLTRTEIEEDDGRLAKPVKPIGNWLSQQEARSLERNHGWTFVERNGEYRRLVPSPRPKRTLQLKAISLLVDAGFTVICAGGGGVPVVRDHRGRMRGIEGVIDKDLTSAMLGEELRARKLVLATDVEGVYADWDGKARDLIRSTSPDEISQLALPAGSMGAKVDAACQFARATARPAVIGALNRLAEVVAGKAGTRIETSNPAAR